jgi:glutamine amidotransferase
MLGVIDYGMGNLQSVVNAFSALKASVFVARGPDELRKADKIILPGVGAFGDGMHNLCSRGWVEALEEEVRRKTKPFLGICLGMQMLAANGTEHGFHSGLAWIPGVTDRLRCGSQKLRIPHIGWNDVRFTRQDGLFKGLGLAQSFYFVHSFAFYPEQQTTVSGLCDYGEDFVASVEMGNIYATQFHPEKSHKTGLAVLQNFLTL